MTLLEIIKSQICPKCNIQMANISFNDSIVMKCSCQFYIEFYENDILYLSFIINDECIVKNNKINIFPNKYFNATKQTSTEIRIDLLTSTFDEIKNDYINIENEKMLFS